MASGGAAMWDIYNAEKGDKESQFNLGMVYKIGFGKAKNFKKAFKWFKLAAEQGHAGAQFNLGLMYQRGYGVIQNYKEAEKWYKLAAQKGYVEAQEALIQIIDNFSKH